LDELLSSGKITQDVYIAEKKVERQQKEKRIIALKDRLKDNNIASEQKIIYQKRLDELELE